MGERKTKQIEYEEVIHVMSVDEVLSPDYPHNSLGTCINQNFYVKTSEGDYRPINYVGTLEKYFVQDSQVESFKKTGQKIKIKTYPLDVFCKMKDLTSSDLYGCLRCDRELDKLNKKGTTQGPITDYHRIKSFSESTD